MNLERAAKFNRNNRVNRFGERDVRHDHRQDLVDPLYEDEYGMRHPVDRPYRSWSEDNRSEAFAEGHRGKGPKGYQRSNESIYEEACEALARDHDLDATYMDMKVEDGCIYLTGEAMSRRDKRLAEEIVEHIIGVKDVQNKLAIRKGPLEAGIPKTSEGDQPGGLIKGLT